MKTIVISIFYVLVMNLFGFSQTMLTDIKFKNLYLEKVDISKISDIKAYQKEKFKNPKGKFTNLTLVSNEKSQTYKLKGTDDLLQITSVYNNEALEKWDKTVAASIETFTMVYEKGIERYTEHINTKNYKSVIFFIKDYKLGNKNYILYKNTDKNIGFFITYISNSPDSVKIDNMRKIIKAMKFE